ncbi:MAG TPA: hypothetical protein VGH54_16790 [Mycobacterium sp.]|uniref:hypothetical protein n=1 Tax=Mycobacterium sp. TaxID=1785 RepID=UPI002F3EDCA6
MTETGADPCPRCGGPRTMDDDQMTIRCAHCATDPSALWEFNIKRSPEVWGIVFKLVEHWDAIKIPADELVWTEAEQLMEKLTTAVKRPT